MMMTIVEIKEIMSFVPSLMGIVDPVDSIRQPEPIALSA
jgi:hypothetical protein